MRIRAPTRTADETRAVGEAFAELLRPARCRDLTGELGAGKTTLVQGIARGLGVTGPRRVAHVHAGAGVSRASRGRARGRLPAGADPGRDGPGTRGARRWRSGPVGGVGDAVEEVLPADHVTIELTGAEDDDTRSPGVHAGRADLGRALGTAGTGRCRDGAADLVIVVGIDTSTPQTSVAIGTDVEVLASVSIAGRARQEAVTPALRQLLAWSGVDLDRVGGIAVGIGPGLFTGLRVGVQTAKTLAQVLGVPIVGITSLDVLAYVVRHTSRRIAAVVDARRERSSPPSIEPCRAGWCARRSIWS